MALTKAQVREIMSTAGADSEKIPDAVDKILEGHTASIEALRERVKQGEQDAETIKTLKHDLKEAQDALKDDTKSPYKVKYDAVLEEKDALQKEFEEFKATVEKESARREKADAYRSLLREQGIGDKRIDAIVKVSDAAIDALTMKDGVIENADDVKKQIADEWGEFIPKEGTKGADSPKPPKNDGGSNFDGMSLADKMSYANDHADDPAVKAWLGK